jgi:GNAT superfamily N-acetyltransferase
LDEVAISRLRDVPSDAFKPLAEEGEAEGWRFVRRLADEWYDGTNRFGRPGEALFGAFSAGTLVGVCGLNVDPLAGDPSVGRVRRLFVTRSFRGRGVGRQLVRVVIAAAAGNFHSLRVRTENLEAGRFYERLGFVPIEGPDCTHFLRLDLGVDAPTSSPYR